MQQIHFVEVAKYPSRESGNACKEEKLRGVHPNKSNIFLFTIELLKDMEESSLYEKVVAYAERVYKAIQGYVKP